MKKIYLAGLILLFSVAGCTSNQPISTSQSTSSETLAAQAKSLKQEAEKSNIDGVLYQVKQCVNSLNGSPSAKLVDGQILALTQDSQNSKALFSSDEKLSDVQVTALAVFKREAQKCRQITDQLTNTQLRKTYQNFFAKLDRVYGDLIYKKITIGVANQERVLLVDDFRMQWRDEIKTSRQGN